ncbi:bile acid:sodium symporter family protein [Oceanihabitans sediminis]|uniref:bile acid:sodium symporter family protein n=1 Tax=Oceanihabitans sediminis TaxID=1812012 RepID=UPI00299EBA12|nr:bile acid:sodium symporter family protein [Oceanihabitans sediminis]MDX1772473.1 bile acid:sodium symporter family protein [Oceanihabitans sediminis]
MRFKIDKFVIAILIVIVVAYLFPSLGSKESTIPFDTIGSIGISLIFFFYGLKLSPDKIRSGLKNWKLHLLVQLTTFLFFPLLVIAFKPLINTEDTQTLWLSFLFLAALPSTVSSSVVMVSIAKGNIPAAIFNASISGLIGIVVTPLWIGLFLTQTTTDYNIQSIYISLITQILLPVILGIILQRFWGKFALKYSKQLTLFDKSIILLIIYKSFAESFAEDLFGSVKATDLLLLFAIVIALFYMVYFITGFISKKLHFNSEDKITAQFCGTKKSLVHGTVFADILFPSSMSIGFILLPLMVFHAAQIFIVSIIATRLAKRENILE